MDEVREMVPTEVVMVRPPTACIESTAVRTDVEPRRASRDMAVRRDDQEVAAGLSMRFI